MELADERGVRGYLYEVKATRGAVASHTAKSGVPHLEAVHSPSPSTFPPPSLPISFQPSVSTGICTVLVKKTILPVATRQKPRLSQRRPGENRSRNICVTEDWTDRFQKK